MQNIHPQEPPRILLALLPTPIVELPRLARSIGASTLLIKRDDLTGLEITGNKIRKLEYLLADAVRQGCDTIITNGGYQSNHCRATAAACARLGLRPILILRGPPGNAPGRVGNLLLDHLFGAQIEMHPPQEYAARRDQLIDNAMTAQRAAGRKPYSFPVGGSVPLGSWGYIRCVHELLQQLPAGAPTDVYVAVSSSGTLAGLVLGKALLGATNLRIVGVPISDKLELFRPDVAQIVRQTIEQFSLSVDPSAIEIELLDGFIGDGYGLPTPQSQNAMTTVASLEGIALDPTYTAKAMAGFLHAITTRHVRNGATPLFIHTGGIFGLMARGDLVDE